jgi:hypothetical protein
MLKIILTVLVLFICTAPLPVLAGDYDGSKPLICVLEDSMECTAGSGCQDVKQEDINLPHILKVNVENKGIRAVGEGERKRVTEIKNVEHIDGKLILQGAEDGFEHYQDGLGWTMSVMESNGDMVLTASGDRVAFVLFGECVPTSYLQ